MVPTFLLFSLRLFPIVLLRFHWLASLTCSTFCVFVLRTAFQSLHWNNDREGACVEEGEKSLVILKRLVCPSLQGWWDVCLWTLRGSQGVKNVIHNSTWTLAHRCTLLTCSWGKGSQRSCWSQVLQFHSPILLPYKWFWHYWLFIWATILLSVL